MRGAIIFLTACGLLAATGCSTQSAPTTSAAAPDLKQTVAFALAEEPQLAQLDVSVNTPRNQLTVSGQVATEQLRNEAIDMVKQASPTATVIDQIEVRPPTASGDYTADMAEKAREKAKAVGDRLGQSLDDAWIYTKIEARLVGDSATPALRINVDVVKKVVTLRGDVNSGTAKEEAERIAKETDGVRMVRNLLKVNA